MNEEFSVGDAKKSNAADRWFFGGLVEIMSPITIISTLHPILCIRSTYSERVDQGRIFQVSHHNPTLLAFCIPMM